MTSATLKALLAAYTDGTPSALSLRQRNLIEEIARIIDTRITIGVGVRRLGAQVIVGDAQHIDITTGISVTEITAFNTILFQPLFNSLAGGTTIRVDGISYLPLRSPTGAELGDDDMHVGRWYEAVALNEPVDEWRLTSF